MKLGNGYDESVRIARGWKGKPKGKPVDFFGHSIEVGDRYFYGNPPTAGVVIDVRRRIIVIDIGADRYGRAEIMNCKSPEKGICIDKVTEGIQ